jgi:hypothetical protein
VNFFCLSGYILNGDNADELVELSNYLLERVAFYSTPIIIFEIDESSVGPTLRVSMLNARREKRPATRARTPGSFSTRTSRVC